MNKNYKNKLSLLFSLVSKKAGADFLYTGMAQGVGLLSSFLAALLITRTLGIEQFGAYALLMSISTFIAAIAEVGIGQTATRYASVAYANSEREKCNEVLTWSLNAKFTIAVGSLVLGLSFSGWLASHVWTGEASPYIGYAFILGATNILQQIANAYFYTHHNFRFVSILTSVNSGLTLAGLLMLVGKDSLSLISVIKVCMTANIITFLLVAIKIPWNNLYFKDKKNKLKMLTLKLRHEDVSSRPLDNKYELKPKTFASYLLASSMVVTLFTRLDIWMLGAFLSDKQVGIYKLATYFSIPLALVVGAFNTILWPRASKLLSKIEIKGFLKKTEIISTILIGPAVLYVITLNWLVPYIFPFHESVITDLAIALSVRYLLAIFITPVAVVGYSLGMSRIYLVVNCLQLTSVFVINAIFINKIGLYAPVVALIFSELVSMAVILPMMHKRVNPLSNLKI